MLLLPGPERADGMSHAQAGMHSSWRGGRHGVGDTVTLRAARLARCCAESRWAAPTSNFKLSPTAVWVWGLAPSLERCTYPAGGVILSLPRLSAALMCKCKLDVEVGRGLFTAMRKHTHLGSAKQIALRYLMSPSHQPHAAWNRCVNLFLIVAPTPFLGKENGYLPVNA